VAELIFPLLHIWRILTKVGDKGGKVGDKGGKVEDKGGKVGDKVEFGECEWGVCGDVCGISHYVE